MALDARITDVVTYTGGITLVLEARDPKDGPAGQPRLEILNPTIVPEVGATIWGGAGFALINTGGMELPYKREGYTKLVQDWEPGCKQ
jgi:hypothetical protein